MARMPGPYAWARTHDYDKHMKQQSSPGAPRVAFFGGSFDPPHLGHLAVARAASADLKLDTVLFAPVGAQPLKPHGSTASFEDRLAMTRLAIAGEPGFAISLADAPKPSGAPNFTLETLLALRAEIPPGGVLFCLMGADSFVSLRHWHRSAEIPFVAPLIVASRPLALRPIASRPGQPANEQLAGLQAALPPGLTIVPAADTQAPAADTQAPAANTQTTTGKVALQSYRLHNSSGQSAPLYVLPGLHLEISASQIRDQIRDRIQPQAGADSPNPTAQQDLLPQTVLDFIRSHGLYQSNV
jgi:nicotinate-nucleotide adenylyltransferase